MLTAAVFFSLFSGLGARLTLSQLKGLENMNGKYSISNSISSKPFNTDYASYENVEYFDVYSPPIKSKYGEVYWTMMPEVPLDESIVKRFNGKVMAIVGYETDQVFRTPSGDKSVPITWAYNHHYIAYLKGNLSEMRQSTPEEAHKFGHQQGSLVWHTFMQEDVEDPNPESGIPVSQWFSEGNGGEFRKSFHGYPQGKAQLLESPVSFLIEPMQIDTKNREYNGTDFRPGLLPKSSAAPPDASYSGLLECPCATRIPKNISVTYNTVLDGLCTTEIHNEKECQEAVDNLGLSTADDVNVIQNSTLPTGCFSVSSQDGTSKLYYNTASESTSTCKGGSALEGRLKSSKAAVEIKMSLDTTNAEVVIEISGPSDKWYAVGIGAKTFEMQDEPYTIVIDGNGNPTERKLGDHSPGNLLKQSLKLISSKVADGVRTVSLLRDFKGISSDHYTFDPTQSSIPVITASGEGKTFGYHGSQHRSGGVVNFVSVGIPTCICYEGVSGTINGIPFNKNCLPEPKGDLLATKNPTCFVDTYQGGQSCCHHEIVLLDTDQDQPEGEMTYHMKFRFWFQEYKEVDEVPTHENLIRLYWQTEAWSSEYDVLKCNDATPREDCVFEIKSNFTVRDMMQDCDVRKNPACWGDVDNNDGINIIYAAGHCHAPSCISMELYNADTNELLCRHDPVYGKSADIFDELGYITIPPCLFGSADEGLPSPTFLSYDTNLYSVKKNNNTNAHYGEMASWQMRGVLAKK